MPKNKSNSNRASDSAPSSVMIYNYPKSLCHEHVSDSDGSMFYAVSFKFKDDWASFIVTKDDIRQAVRKNGEIIPDRVNILLGSSDDIRSVSIRADDGENYISQPMFNSTICSAIASDRKNYMRSIAV